MYTRTSIFHRLLLFCFICLSFAFCGVPFNVADAVSTGTVAFRGSAVTANIRKGTQYEHDGPRKVSSNVEVTAEGESRRVVLEEKWKTPPGKPPDITVFTFKVTAKGQGRILLTLNRDDGGPTSREDVGGYRGLNDPYSLENEENFYLYQYVPHENIRDYEDGFDSPYDDDCVPVKHKGYNLEVVTGREELDAVAKAYSEKISIAYGTEQNAQQALGLTGGWGTAAIEASFVNGTKSTWGWSLVEDPQNFSGDSMDSFFTVTVTDSVSIQQGEAQSPACTTCDNCSEFVHNKTEHFLGLCPLDPNVDGCGLKRWSCETSEQLAWHQIRTCKHGSELTSPMWPFVCDAKFRHCTNGKCWHRWIKSRGHSDGSVPQATAGVTNAYAESHLIDPTPEPEPTPVPSETIDNTPDCSSCTDGCSTCQQTTTPAVSQTPGLRPVNGSTYYANGGDIYNMELTTSEAYTFVYWYIKSPGDMTAYGNNIEIDNGDGSTTTASLSYTLPSDNGGNYRITAYIYYSDRIAEETYDVYVY